MDNASWNDKIKKNFNKAATNYSEYCSIQKYFSTQIINLMKGIKLPEGDWFDLGSGTGLLADEIEKVFAQRKVARVDFSDKMLKINKKGSNTILWDLNKGLHPSIENSSLFVSNFCIHWLNQPEKTLENWLNKLNGEGKIIISYPTSNSFPEWKKTCEENNIEYTGLVFPKVKNILKNLSPNEIISTKTYLYKENFEDIFKLFRSIINVGAQSSKGKKISVGEFKKLEQYWPKDKNKRVALSWEINILALKKT
tara:strand:- start:12356 stop:13114 length:759 start_codon:yes stop_codon:yes gene_type:complete